MEDRETPRRPRLGFRLLPDFPPVAGTPSAPGPPAPLPLGQLDVLRANVVRRREVAPIERTLLPVGLAQRDRQPGLHQLPTQVESMAALLHAQLGEDLLNVSPADEDLVVEDGD